MRRSDAGRHILFVEYKRRHWPGCNSTIARCYSVQPRYKTNYTWPYIKLSAIEYIVIVLGDPMRRKNLCESRAGSGSPTGVLDDHVKSGQWCTEYAAGAGLWMLGQIFRGERECPSQGALRAKFGSTPAVCELVRLASDDRSPDHALSSGRSAARERQECGFTQAWPRQRGSRRIRLSAQ